MQNHVIARPLRVSQLIEIYNAAIGQTYKIHGQHCLSDLKQTDKEKPPERFYKLLPLHFNFCLTTLKNEALGNDANGSVFFALRMVTVEPRSTCIGLRPSSVRHTG